MAKIGFRRGQISDEKEGLEQYLGKWVVITLNNSGRSESGFLRDITHEHLVLNPYVTTSYTKGSPEAVIAETEVPFSIGKSLHGSIRPTTREELAAFCNYTNEQQKREQQKNEQEKEKSKGDK